MKRAPQGSKSKPFCDCATCACQDCPDVVKLVGIPKTDKKSELRPKGGNGKSGAKKKGSKRVPQLTISPTLLGPMNDDRDCTCEIMARTVRSHVHMNLGLPHRNSPHPPEPEPDDSNPK